MMDYSFFSLVTKPKDAFTVFARDFPFDSYQKLQRKCNNDLVNFRWMMILKKRFKDNPNLPFLSAEKQNVYFFNTALHSITEQKLYLSNNKLNICADNKSEPVLLVAKLSSSFSVIKKTRNE